MVKALAIVLLTAVSGFAQLGLTSAFYPPVLKRSTPPTYFFLETFEGTGYVNTWTESGTMIDEDWSTPALVGSQSLNMDSESAIKTYSLFAPKNTVYVKVHVAISNLLSAPMLTFTNGTEEQFSLNFHSSGNWFLYHGATASAFGGSITTNVYYRFWLDYSKGTGANGIANGYMSTTDTKPGSPQIAVTTGTSTNATSSVNIVRTGGGVGTFDNIELSDTAIP